MLLLFFFVSLKGQNTYLKIIPKETKGTLTKLNYRKNSHQKQMPIKRLKTSFLPSSTRVFFWQKRILFIQTPTL